MPSSNKERDTRPRSGTGAMRSTIEWPTQGRRRRTANDGRMTKLCCRLLQPHEGTTKAPQRQGFSWVTVVHGTVRAMSRGPASKCFDLPSSPASGVSRSCVVALGFPSKGRPCHAMPRHDTPIARLITSRPSLSLASSSLSCVQCSGTVHHHSLFPTTPLLPAKLDRCRQTAWMCR